VNGRLTFWHDHGDLSCVPTADEWEKFWEACDNVGLWSWPAEVGDQEVIDGLLYNVEIERGSPPGFEEALMRVHRALQALVGWCGAEETPGERH
jgi:hypothetical protein